MRPGEPWQVSDELIIERAVAYALLSEWQVDPADCRVQIAASRELLAAGTPSAWVVFMVAHPRANAQLRKEMPLSCKVEMIEGQVCAVQLFEPADRTPYLW